jgi:lysine/ornithine N-monooxygenase
MTDTTTIRVKTTTRDRIRTLGGGRSADDVILAALNELERRRINDLMREQSLAISRDPAELAEAQAIAEDLEYARAW